MAKPEAVQIPSLRAVARSHRRRGAALLFGIHLGRSVRGIPCAPPVSR